MLFSTEWLSQYVELFSPSARENVANLEEPHRLGPSILIERSRFGQARQ